MLGLFLAFMGWIFSVYMILLIAFVYFYRMKLGEAVAVIGANLAAGTIAVIVGGTGGGSVDAMQLFRDFRGRDAEIAPLLKRRGLEA